MADEKVNGLCPLAVVQFWWNLTSGQVEWFSGFIVRSKACPAVGLHFVQTDPPPVRGKLGGSPDHAMRNGMTRLKH